VRGVDDDDVHLRVDECAGAIESFFTDADRCAAAQTSERIFRRKRIAPGLLNVFDGDEAFEVAVLIDDEKFLDAMLVKNFARLLERRTDRSRDEIFFRHALRDRKIEARFESQIAIGENADEFSIRVGHRDAGDLVLLHHLHRLGDRLPRTHRHRIDDHPRFRALHLVDLFGLTIDRHVLVDDAEAAVLRHRDREAGFGDRIHRRGEDGDVQPDVAREACGNIDEIRVKVGLGGPQQHIVKRQPQIDRLGKTFRGERFGA